MSPPAEPGVYLNEITLVQLKGNRPANANAKLF
jgi:hypothetical protein